MKPRSFQFLCALLGLGSPALAANPTLTIDATQIIRSVDDAHFGVNSVMWDPQVGSAQTAALVKEAGITLLRIPGGSISDDYHWTTNRSGTNAWSWASGMNAFATLITSTGAQTTAVVNYGSGTPEEAAAWVAYANAPATLLGTAADVPLGTDAKGQAWSSAGTWSQLRAATPLAKDDGSNFLRLGMTTPLGIHYWEIGNECYGSWETDTNSTTHDPYTYAVRAKDYIARMRAVDPGIRIGVVIINGEDAYANNTQHPTTNPRTKKVHNGWTPVVLATLKTLGVTPDFAIYHRYEQQPGQESDAKLLQSSSTWANDAADLRQQLNDYLGEKGPAVELFITENNSVSYNPGKQTTSVVNALFCADSVGSVLQTEFSGFVWWALRNSAPLSNGSLLGNQSASLYGWRNYGDYGMLSSTQAGISATDYERYPSYYAMKLLQHFAHGGDMIVKATSDSNLLSAYAASRKDGTVSLLVINKDPASDQTATIRLSNFSPHSTATVRSWGIAQDEAARTGTGSTDIATTAVTGAAASFQMSFPHYSLSVVTFTQKAPEILVQPGSVNVGTGARVSLSVVANGGGSLSYQWSKDGVPVSGATASSLLFPSVNGGDAGSYSVTVTDAAGTSVSSAPANLGVSPTPYTVPASFLTNISTRARVGTGGAVMVAGFTIGEGGAKKVLLRAVGPTLGAFGVDGTLANPRLELTTLSGVLLATNDDWATADQEAIARAGTSVGAFDLAKGSRDAALIVTLPAGNYTMLVKGANDTTGIALAEVYDLDSGSAARLTNLSTRAYVGTGAEQMIAGFVINGSGKSRLLLRAVGPTLAAYGLSGTLADPQLILKTLSGTSLDTNDDWSSSLAATFSSVGAFPMASPKDAALLESLGSGQYTPAITGSADGTGVALVEAYVVP